MHYIKTNNIFTPIDLYQCLSNILLIYTNKNLKFYNIFVNILVHFDVFENILLLTNTNIDKVEICYELHDCKL